MRIDEAIEILQYHSERNADVGGSDWANALKLGIEALKRQKEDMLLHVWTFPRPLLGETTG